MNQHRNRPGDGLALGLLILGLFVVAVIVLQVGLAVLDAR